MRGFVRLCRWSFGCCNFLGGEALEAGNNVFGPVAGTAGLLPMPSSPVWSLDHRTPACCAAPPQRPH